LQLAEATASLDLKTSAISELETQVEWLKASLDSITADLEGVQRNLKNAELAKAAADKELADTKAALVTSQGDGGELEQVSEEVRLKF
jgi:chromosome segregation ATPase